MFSDRDHAFRPKVKPVQLDILGCLTRDSATAALYLSTQALALGSLYQKRVNVCPCPPTSCQSACIEFTLSAMG